MAHSVPTIQLTAPRFLLLFTSARIGDFVDEISDQIKVHNYQTRIRVYGTTHKGRQGFVMLEWESDIVAEFVDKWMRDPDVTEVLPF